MEITMLENTKGTVIKVVGVGGAGGNAVQHMINKGVSGVEFIVANTDAQALNQSASHKLIQLGATGLGAGVLAGAATRGLLRLGLSVSASLRPRAAQSL